MIDVVVLLLRSSRDRLHFGQQVAEFAVVHFHAVVQVEADAHAGVVAQLFIKSEEFQVLLLQRLDLFAEAGACSGGRSCGAILFQ